MEKDPEPEVAEAPRQRQRRRLRFTLGGDVGWGGYFVVCVHRLSHLHASPAVAKQKKKAGEGGG